MASRRPLTVILLLAIAAMLTLLALAAFVALLGYPVEGAKAAIYVVLFPGVLMLAAALVVLIRDPRGHDSFRGLAAILVTSGGLLFIVPLLAWLPFSPMHLRIGRLPPILAVPFVAGVGLFASGVTAIFLASMITDWRDRDYPGMAANLVAIVVVVGISAWLIRNRLT